jgi:hypothetical protein
VAVVAGLTVLRGIFATTIELRVDEAYYWTWSKEGVMSFLDHPPPIAWFISTALFGDNNFGVRWSCSCCWPTSCGGRCATGTMWSPSC